MTTVTDALARIPEDELDPAAGRYVAVQHWAPGKLTLSTSDPEYRMRDVYDADAYAEETGRWYDVEELDPGHLYDRTTDMFYPVAEWVAMRRRNAEAGRQAATLARVERVPGMPRSKHAVDAVAVTEDGSRRLFTVARDHGWCGACGQHESDHPGYVPPPAPRGAWPGPDDSGEFGALLRELEAQQEESARMRRAWAARVPHAYRRDPARLTNVIARDAHMRAAFPDTDPVPAWLAAAWAAWSPESVRLGEMRAAGEISADDFDAVSAWLTWPWWRYHDDQWAGWSERLADEERKRQREQRRQRRVAALDATAERRAQMRARAINGDGSAA